MRSIAVSSESINNSNLKIDNHTINFSFVDGTEKVPFPSEETSNKILVRKLAFSLNFRDKALIKMAADFIKKKELTNSFFPVGSEFVALVERVGSAVSDIKVGDLVIPDCAYPFNAFQETPGVATNNASKEYEIFPESKLIKIPKKMPLEVAASFSIGAQTSYSMIRKADLKKNSNVLVTSGTSNTSLFLINALKLTGANISVLTSNPANVDRFIELSAKKVFTVEKPADIVNNKDFLNYVESINGFDAVLDPLSDIHLQHLIHFVALEGKYITCGFYNQSLPLLNDYTSLSKLLGKAITRNISIIGSCLGSHEDLKKAIYDFEHHNLTVVVDSVFTENDLPAFINRTFNDRERFGKVVLKYS